MGQCRQITPRQRKIVVTARFDNQNTAVFKAEDNGTGIRKEFLPHIVR
jgi:signal transduction histidine kinase